MTTAAARRPEPIVKRASVAAAAPSHQRKVSGRAKGSVTMAAKDVTSSQYC